MPHNSKINQAPHKAHIWRFLAGFIVAVILLGGSFSLVHNQQLNTPTKATVTLPKKHPVSKTLTIPALKLTVPVSQNLTKKNMRTHVCQVKPNDYPGMNGNLVIAGHNYVNKTLFSDLAKVKLGQKIIINNYYVYHIDKIKIIHNDYHFTNHQQPQITLYTCLDQSNPKYRLMVQGHLVAQKVTPNAKT